MTVPRDSFAVLYVFWEGYSNQTVNNLIKQTKAGISSSGTASASGAVGRGLES